MSSALSFRARFGLWDISFVKAWIGDDFKIKFSKNSQIFSDGDDIDNNQCPHHHEIFWWWWHWLLSMLSAHKIYIAYCMSITKLARLPINKKWY
jgi:hypothetical protein